MNGCRITHDGFGFTPQEIAQAVSDKRLLSMEIELSLRCNFRCPYCYVPDKSVLDNELRLEEILDAAAQAKALGARRIILLGGEPMLYPYLFEVLDFLKSQDLEVEMFSNGFGITSGIAEKLLDYRVNVVLKMNSFDEQVQDELCGHKGAYTVIHDAFKSLRAAGYPSRTTFMAASTIICRQNIHELRDLWCWLRDQNILPYFEMITPQGDAALNDWLMVDPKEVEDLFNDINRIDRERYGYEWDIQPPLVGNKCLRHQFSCLVSSQGDVMPCVGVPIAVGNIRARKLKDIISDSEVIQNLRDYTKTIKGPCGQCDNSSRCYGCRGAAYNLTGDYLASDPMCWKNIDRQAEIDRLPMPVTGLIPQKEPMRIVDTLLRVGERYAEVAAEVRKDSPFVDEDGELDESVYMEMIAQSIAAMNGFLRRGMDEDVEGFLLGAKDLAIHEHARVGDRLAITVRKEAKLGDFGIISGRICRGDLVLAEGEIKVYHKTEPEA